MEEEIKTIEKEAQELLAIAKSEEEVEKIRVSFLGKKGKLTQMIKDIPNFPPQQRPLIGRALNELKNKLSEAIETRLSFLRSISRKRGMIDVTLPGIRPQFGRKHPLTQVIDEIKSIFIGLGFEVVEGPEIETEYHNFIALNIPPEHPVRDEHDSFYITDDILLRTETSAVQIRVMEARKPPIRIIAPGRVFRRDQVDATHSHTFHQVEGLMVDKGITFSDLKGVLTLFCERMFGKDVKMRFRPDYFPFTEPSADASISCIMCGGEGCRVCSYTGWLEILGCGMVHPQVLRNVGYDPSEWQGFAFGMGVERIAMLKYRIDDIRLFLENDLRFLKQF
ncbi:phenylalanine--tRNA ligase subunit alpha [bacterium]|nr:phenylalanine--tRNA ligase subunit alpha [bacterium]